MFDLGALFRKIGGDQSADILPNVNFKQTVNATNDPVLTIGGKGGGQEALNPYNDVIELNQPTSPTRTDDPITDPAALQVAQQAAQKRALMEASLAAIQQNIDALGTRKNNTLSGIDSRYASILQKYADQEAQNAARYGKETEANEGTYSRNQSLALQSAASGRQGLMATLGSIGALGPTALNLANRAVARSANMDLGEAGRTFTGNATTLTDEFNKTKQDEENRRLEAETARTSDRQSAEYDYLEALQKAYSDMAGVRAQGGDVAGANASTRQAGDLYSQLAAKTKPVTSPYQSRDIALDTSNLAKYLAGQRQNTVSAENGLVGGPRAMNSPIYSIGRRREELV